MSIIKPNSSVSFYFRIINDFGSYGKRCKVKYSSHTEALYKSYEGSGTTPPLAKSHYYWPMKCNSPTGGVSALACDTWYYRSYAKKFAGTSSPKNKML